MVSEDGSEYEFLKRPENFRLILASNTYGYAGVNLQSDALRSRTHEITMDFEFDAIELATLLESKSIPKDLALNLGQIMVKVHKYFQKQNPPEMFSLREVWRIKEFYETYARYIGLKNTSLKAFEHVLFASLPIEKRQGALGQGLVTVLSEFVVPDGPGRFCGCAKASEQGCADGGL